MKRVRSPVGGQRPKLTHDAAAGHRGKAAVRLRTLGLLMLAVAACVVAAHWPALSARALTFDDDQYLLENNLVRQPGWTSTNRFFGEVLTPSTVEGYYQPLAMISLMLDYAAAGDCRNLGPFHRTSLAIHVMNTCLVILLLYQLFGEPWAAALVGLLFGVHPLTVEPIPWVGERKTLIAAFFALTCLNFYVRYAQRPRWPLYAASLAAFVLALLSKPTSTPLPLAMVLLDLWPLRRLGRRAVLEKIPFFVIAGASSVITFISQARTATVALPSDYSPGWIPLVLCHNIVFYLYKIVWPVNLSPHYPFPEPVALSVPMVLAGVVGTGLLVVLLAVSLRWTRAFLTGWLIFFVMMLPTMQIIGFTNVIASDKFAYLPSVGLLCVLAWLVGRLWSAADRVRWPGALRGATVVVAMVLAGLEGRATYAQGLRWQTTETLYRHMIDLAPRAWPLYHDLAQALCEQQRVGEAIEWLEESIRLRPNNPRAYYHLGIAHSLRGETDAAIGALTTAVQQDEAFMHAHTALGLALTQAGRFDEAVKHLCRATELKPEYALARNNLGLALVRMGRLDEAIQEYQRAIDLDPTLVAASVNLGAALIRKGRIDEALAVYAETVDRHPENASAHFALAAALHSQNRFNDAIKEYRRVLKLDPKHAGAKRQLDAALAARDAGTK